MRFIDSLKFALNNLTTRGLRSWLTIIGVIIGVASIIAIVSVGQGMQNVISSQLGALGSDQVYIMPGSSMESQMMSRGGFAKEPGDIGETDLKIIKSVEGVLAAAPDLMGFVNVEYKNQKAHVYLIGSDENWKTVREASFGIESGRFLTSNDRGVVVLGNKLAHEAFDDEIYVGSQLKIENKTYRVIGVLNEFGGLGGSNEDNSVYMTLDDARPYSGGLGVKDYYAIEVKVEQGRTDEIAQKIEERLMASRHVTEETIDFSVYTPKMLMEMVMSILGTINLFLYGIAAISLVVGAVGIANTMFTSVTERTRQIGILKALGMTRKDIMNLFLVESALIGLVGGILGLLIGFIISGIIGQIASIFLANTRIGGASLVSISPALIIFAIVFSISIGILSGIFPARRAAKLQPVEALRYE